MKYEDRSLFFFFNDFYPLFGFLGAFFWSGIHGLLFF